MDNNVTLLQNDLDSGILGKSYKSSLTEVIGTMAGFELFEAQTPVESSIHNQITGVMLLTGDYNSVFSLSASKETVMQLVSFMTGIPAYELKDEDLLDGITELVNMIAGRVKVILADTPYRFKLTTPFAISGENQIITHKDKVARLIKLYKQDDMEIMMKLFFI